MYGAEIVFKGYKIAAFLPLNFDRARINAYARDLQ